MPVFVVDADRRPLAPCHPAAARKLLASGKAAVLRRYPFTLILKRAVNVTSATRLRLKIDPGSRITGLAVLNDSTGAVLFAAEVEHRGERIQAALAHRHTLRRARRNRKTRYRKPRFDNRQRRTGSLPPPIESRIAHIETWVSRLRRLAPIRAISLELVRFDTQAMQNPEISGVEYQQGELAGYEVREYLLEKWQRRCAYCDAHGVPLQVEHIRPRSRGGSNRISNLCLACVKCNQAKNDRSIEEFLAAKPDLLQRLLARAQASLKNAAVMNAARWELFRRLERTGLPVETGSGGRTKLNRTRQGLPKAHWIDAACVGASTPGLLGVERVRPLVVKATGHGVRQRCITDRFGLPIKHRPLQRVFHGFQTGDLVRAVIPSGKFAGRYVGRVAVRSRPSFRLLGFDVRPTDLTRLHRADGYNYEQESAFLLRAAVRAPRADAFR